MTLSKLRIEERQLTMTFGNFCLTCCRIVELTEDQRTQIYSAPDFLEFVESSSKIVQRALSDGYDYIKDYTSGGEGDL